MYLKGYSLDEFEKVKEEIEKQGFEYKKVNVGEALRDAIPRCLGAEYKNPSSMRLDAPGAFSCSSLVSYLYVQAGIWMPSLSIDKFIFAKPLSKEELGFGDLVFSNTGNGKVRFETVEYQPGTPVPQGVDHVALYLGDGQILHATKRAGKVLIEKMDENLIGKIVGFGRVADVNEERVIISIPETINVT